MTDALKKRKNFVGYEYKEITADDSMISLLLDGYENFGWEINESGSEGGAGGKAVSISKTMVRMRRDRKIVNKAELTRLQRNF